MTNGTLKVLIHGIEYSLHFPSLRRVKELGKKLQLKDGTYFDPLRSNPKDIDWTTILDDEKKTMDFLKLVIFSDFDDKILDDLTAGDLTILATDFFLRGTGDVLMKSANGENYFDAMLRTKISPKSQQGTESTTQSIAPPKETLNDVDGSGTTVQ